MPPLHLPISDSKFVLDAAALAGLFVGQEIIEAMATFHLYRGRRWLGWFNSPGTYVVAKWFQMVVQSQFRDENNSFAASVGFDGKAGPDYIAALSGTRMRTGYLAYLAMKRSKELKATRIKGRTTKPCDVAYLTMKHVNHDAQIQLLPFWDACWPGFVAIAVSFVTCLMCALVYDWFSFSMILLGIFSNGFASMAMGMGRLKIQAVQNSAYGPGHGILIGEDNVMVIKGEERGVNRIIKGRFVLKFNADYEGEQDTCHANTRFFSTYSRLLLMVQFVQVLLIPQGTLFGQIMFITSLGVSWLYSLYLSSLEGEKIHTHILFQTLGSTEICRFRAGTRTTMAVFACLLLFHGVNTGLPEEEDRNLRENILHSFLPNNTVVWRHWRKQVIDQLLHIDSKLSHIQPEQNPLPPEQNLQLSGQDRTLLNYLLDDAMAAFRAYLEIRGTIPSN